MLGDYEEPIDDEPRDEAGSSKSAAPRSVPGAPGVLREGNSYSAAPPDSPSASAPQAGSPRPNFSPPEAPKNPGAAGNVLDQFGGGITMPDNWQRSDGGAPAPAASFGEIQNRINDQRAQRTGGSLYGTPRAESTTTQAANGPGSSATQATAGGGSFPGILEVGTSGQPSLVSTLIARPVRNFFADSAAAARGEGDYNAMRDARAGASPSAAATASRGLSSAGDLMNGASESPLGDASPLKNFANPPAPRTPGVPLVSAQAQPTPSGRGSVMSIDMNAANRSLAAANQVRQDYLDSQAGSDGGPRGGVIHNPDGAANETLARWGQERMIQRAIDSGNPKIMEGVAALSGVGGKRYEVDARIASDERTARANRTHQAGIEMARLGIDRERLGIDRRNATTHHAAQGIDMQRTLQQLNGERQLTALRERIINPSSAGDAALASRQLAAIQGKEQQNAQVIYNEELINPAQPADGTRRVPMILNRDGTATAVTPRTAPKALPNGVSRDAAIQAARRALQGGYDQAAVLARLGEYGLSAEDLRQ